VKHDEFIGRVQQRARLDSRGAAERATRATLETLGRRLAGGAPSNLGAQLPPEIKLHLERVEDDQTQSFELDEFYERVAREEGPGTELPSAVFHARAVMSVVRDAVSPGAYETVVDQLPEEYADLFDWEGATSPS
jgi:uncharacterized protein (DUF2267 family)